MCINIDRLKREENKGSEEREETHQQQKKKKLKISMDHSSLRCFGTIPKTHFLLLFSFSIFLFTFTNAAFDLATIPFNDGYSHLFGDGNVVRSSDGNGVKLLLDRYTGKLN